jgi:hypothetical protein
MKRDIVPKYQWGVFNEFPLFFWKPCCNCKKEFRREKGYSFLHFGGGDESKMYICASCCPTIEEAHDFAINKKWLNVPDTNN